MGTGPDRHVTAQYLNEESGRSAKPDRESGHADTLKALQLISTSIIRGGLASHGSPA